MILHLKPSRSDGSRMLEEQARIQSPRCTRYQINTEAEQSFILGPEQERSSCCTLKARQKREGSETQTAKSPKKVNGMRCQMMNILLPGPLKYQAEEAMLLLDL